MKRIANFHPKHELFAAVEKYLAVDWIFDDTIGSNKQRSFFRLNHAPFAHKTESLAKMSETQLIQTMLQKLMEKNDESIG